VELIAAVAIGLNPFVAGFVLAGLAAFTTYVPIAGWGGVVTPATLGVAALAIGTLIPLDLVFSKFVAHAPAARRASEYAAPLLAALAAFALDDLPVSDPLLPAMAATLAWGVAAMLTRAAARASRSPAWVGLGHIPVLMSAATASACIIPLGAARQELGLALGALATLVLLAATLQGLRLAAHPPSVLRRRHGPYGHYPN
jgi:hypothetical protein